ncbi:MAG TPA: hypothetical protein VLA19_31540, partial [Herpetosiphonaceae bacterium]|nr:hypothetical protein [Herpetosiphonaceae bacterium]
TACALCAPDLGPILTESRHWRLVLNHNQNLLGKCFLALRRHEELVPGLTLDEWADLHRQLALATHALTAAFQPEHFNYAFLQNQDRHVHLHVIPRYAALRRFGREVFEDPDYPGHYRVPSPAHRLLEDDLAALAATVQRSLMHVDEQDPHE